MLFIDTIKDVPSITLTSSVNDRSLRRIALVSWGISGLQAECLLSLTGFRRNWYGGTWGMPFGRQWPNKQRRSRPLANLLGLLDQGENLILGLKSSLCNALMLALSQESILYNQSAR